MGTMGKRPLIIFITSVIMILLMVFLYFYWGFNGNPFTRAKSEKTMKKYLSLQYPNEDFSISKPFYNFKFGYYISEVTSKDNRFNIKINRGQSYLEEDNLTEKLSKALLEDFNMLTGGISKTAYKTEVMISPRIITTDKLKNGVKRYDIFWINLYDADKQLTREEFQLFVDKTLDIIKSSKYSPRLAYIDYFCKNNNTSFSLKVEEKDFEKPTEEIYKLIK